MAIDSTFSQSSKHMLSSSDCLKFLNDGLKLCLYLALIDLYKQFKSFVFGPLARIFVSQSFCYYNARSFIEKAPFNVCTSKGRGKLSF